jgi:phosphoglycerate dehydrogenase-like enzyme
VPEILILDEQAETLAAAVADAFEQHTGQPPPPMWRSTTLDGLTAPMRSAEVLLAPPTLAAAALSRLHQLRWIQSSWAGVTPILRALADRPAQAEVPVVTAAKGLFGPRMAEYVFGWLTAIERRLLDYHDLRRQHRWHRLEQRDLSDRTLLLVGTGSIGAHLAAVAGAFGMRVLGVSRRGRAVPGIERVAKVMDLHSLLGEADYVVSSLPDTAASRHLFDRDAFAAMRDDAILINVGRGSAIEQRALLDTLHADRLRAVVLDVFDVEPLPSDHPFWRAPRLHLTPHVAAFTPFDGIARVFAQNLARYLADEALNGRVDIDAGY